MAALGVFLQMISAAEALRRAIEKGQPRSHRQLALLPPWGDYYGFLSGRRLPLGLLNPRKDLSVRPVISASGPEEVGIVVERFDDERGVIFGDRLHFRSSSFFPPRSHGVMAAK